MSILLIQSLKIYVLIKIYYYYFKRFIIHISPTVASILSITKHYSYSKSSSMVELPLIASTHFIFCFILSWLLNINLFQSELYYLDLKHLFLGALLGIGLMGFSTLMCQVGMAVLTLSTSSVPKDLTSWLTIAKGGWLRHHTHVLKTMPHLFSLSIVMMQILSEELVFRGVLLPFYLVHGKYLALFISIFFICHDAKIFYA